MTHPPLALDIDGTLTDAEGVVDPRAIGAVRDWPAPVVFATGKSFPYPVALAHFCKVPETVVAENGGVVLVDGEVQTLADADRPREAYRTFRERGGDPGYPLDGTVNRWRETEVALSLETADGDLLRRVADEFDLAVYDTGYAYHLKSPTVDKGDGLRAVAAALGYEPSAFAAIGDSENDVPAFAAAGRSFAVANADAAAREAADVVLEAGYFDGALAALDRLAGPST